MVLAAAEGAVQLFDVAQHCFQAGHGRGMQNDANSFATLGILIVDDDANIRKTMAYCLAKEGHAVIAVSNAADGLDEARRPSPSWI